MPEIYELYINDIKIKEFPERNQAHAYINKEHNEMLPFLDYNPIGAGDLEKWENGHITIQIVRSLVGKVDVLKLLEDNMQEKREDHPEKIREINITKIMPCTPKRTRIYDNKNKLEEAKEGKIVIKDGKKYISKKDKKGNFKWIRHYEDNYSKQSTTKRKCPKQPAKNFKEGTVKKGIDGKMWKVTESENGNKRWIKK